MRKTGLLRAIVLVSLAGCALERAKPARPDLAVEARGVMEAAARAFDAHDVAGLTALFDENAAVVWPVSPPVTTSPEELRSNVARAVKVAGAAKATLESLRVARVGGQRALVVSTWTVGGAKTPKRQLVATDVLVQRDGGWRYLLDVVEPMAGPAARRGRTAPAPAAPKLGKTQCSALREWCMQACKGSGSADGTSDDCGAACLAGESHCTSYGSATLFALGLL